MLKAPTAKRVELYVMAMFFCLFVCLSVFSFVCLFVRLSPTRNASDGVSLYRVGYLSRNDLLFSDIVFFRPSCRIVSVCYHWRKRYIGEGKISSQW